MRKLLKIFLLANSFVQVAHGQMKDDFKKEAEKEGSTQQQALILWDQRGIRLGDRLIVDPNFQPQEWPWSFSLSDFLAFFSENIRSVERGPQNGSFGGGASTGLALRSSSHRQLSDIPFLRPLQFFRAFQRHCATFLQQEQLRQMNSETNQVELMPNNIVLDTINIELPRLPYPFLSVYQVISQRKFMDHRHRRMRGRGGENQLMLFLNRPLQNIQHNQQSVETDLREGAGQEVEMSSEICLEGEGRSSQSLERVRQVEEIQLQEEMWEGIDHPWEESPTENVNKHLQSERSIQQLADQEALPHEEKTWEEAIRNLGKIIQKRLTIGIRLQPISESSIMMAREKRTLKYRSE